MAKLRGKIANVMKDMCIIIPAKTKVLKFFVALFEEELIWTTNGRLNDQFYASHLNVRFYSSPVPNYV